MKYSVVAYPYARQYGTIEVPDNVPEAKVDDYIKENWEKIQFNEPDLDYFCVDFDTEKVEDTQGH